MTPAGATLLPAAGVPVKVISERPGHSTLAARHLCAVNAQQQRGASGGR